MIEELSSKTRRTIVRCRCLAMLGDVDSALAEIDESLAPGAEDSPLLDQVGLLSLKAELLYLECREDESLKVFEESIKNRLSALSQEDRFIVSQNKRNVAVATRQFSNDRQAELLHDQQQLTGTKLWDAPAMVQAYESAFDGRHYEALPPLWRELINSYRQGIWSYYRQASKRLTREFIQIGWAHVAEFHAIISQSSESIDVIADNLLGWRRPELTGALVKRVLHYANLKRHAVVACKLFIRIADAVPDSEVENLMRWLVHRAAIVPTGLSDLNLVSASWDALQALAPRLTIEQARDLVHTATTHESWTKEKADHLRPHIVGAVDQCVSILKAEDLPELAKRSIHMASGMSQDVNYDKAVLHLFRHISHRSDNVTKELIRDALYDKSSVNLDFIRIAKEFGKDVESKEQVQQMAEHFTQDVRLQVQHLAPGEDFKKSTISLGQVTYRAGDAKVAVSLYSAMGLRAVIAHRHRLDIDSVNGLLEAILDMLREPQNILANKVLMINGIIELADTLTNEQAEEVFVTLRPIASGEVVGLDVTGAAGDPNHPLNPFKTNLGDPATVQGGALMALSSIEASLLGIYGERLMDLIQKAMTNPNAEVRELALMAARRTPTVSEPVLMGTFLATRDNVPDVVEEALLTLNSHVRDTMEFWDLLGFSLNMAVQSQHTNVRRAAAFTIRNLTAKCTNDSVATQMKDLKKLLATDASHTVRQELSLHSAA